MRERGGMTVLHEPFMYHHYLTTRDRLFPDFRPDPAHPATYGEIRAMIREPAAARAVFFKDMAYYVVEALPRDPGFMAEMTHAFLIRDPAEAAVSYARRDPGFTRTELGHEAQWRLFQALRAEGAAPLILTADQVRGDPEGTLRRYWAHIGAPFTAHAFAWDDRVPDGWEAVKGWHGEVLESGGIRKPPTSDAAAALAALGPPFTDHVAHHAPFYSKMREIAEAQAHQK